MAPLLIKLTTILFVFALLLSSIFVGRNGWYLLMMVPLALAMLFLHVNTSFSSIDWVIACFLLFVLVSLIPLPSSLLNAQSEYRYNAENTLQRIHTIQGNHSQLGASEVYTQKNLPASSISMNLAGTWRFFLYALSLWCLLLVIPSTQQSLKESLGWICFTVLFVGILAGVISKLFIPQGKTILWLNSVPHGSPVGPFVNKNHYGFCCLLFIGSAFHQFNQLLQAKTNSRFIKKSLTAFVIGSIGIALLGLALSLSRGAFVAGLGATVLVASVCLCRANGPTVGIISICAVAFTLLVALYPSKELNERLNTLLNIQETHSAQTRWQSWTDSLDMWQAHPLIGIGAESFRTTYPIYQTVNTRKTLTYAENEYIQTLAEHGLIGIVIILALLGLLQRQLIHKFRNAPASQQAIIVWIAAVTLMHCLVDFPLRHPTNAIALVILLGILLPSKQSKPFFGFSKVRGQNVSAFLHFAPKAFILLFSTTAFWGLAQGNQLWSLDSGEYLNPEDRTEIIASLQNAPTYAYAWQLLGYQLMEDSRSNQYTTAQSFALQNEALHCFEKATQYAPSNYQGWMLLGDQALNGGDQNLAREAYKKATELRPYLKNELERRLKKQP